VPRMAFALLIAQASLRATDWFGVGLLLCLAGGFLLANAALFLTPRARESFHGIRSDLRALRDAVFFRVQIFLGFLFLLSGLGLELFGRYAGDAGPAEFPVFAAGGVVLAVVLFEVAGSWVSHAFFRRSLREHFLRQALDLESDSALAREVGGLIDMPSRSDETVQSYVERLRRALSLPAPGRRERPLPRATEADEDLVH
jgi:hypothetical protein